MATLKRQLDGTYLTSDNKNVGDLDSAAANPRAGSQDQANVDYAKANYGYTPQAGSNTGLSNIDPTLPKTNSLAPPQVPQPENESDIFNLMTRDALLKFQGVNTADLEKKKRALQRTVLNKQSEITDEDLRTFSPAQQEAIRSGNINALIPEIDDVAYQLSKAQQATTNFENTFEKVMAINQDYAEKMVAPDSVVENYKQLIESDPENFNTYLAKVNDKTREAVMAVLDYSKMAPKADTASISEQLAAEKAGKTITYDKNGKPILSNKPTDYSSVTTKQIANAIKQIESNGNYEAEGGSGEFGAYQFMPSTWSDWSSEYANSVGSQGGRLPVTLPLDQSQENQDIIAEFKIDQWLNQGLTPEQIAAKWNSGSEFGWENKITKGFGGTMEPNQYGQEYNVPEYVKKVTSALDSIMQSSEEQESNIDGESESILAVTGLSMPSFMFLTRGTTALSRMSSDLREKYMGEAEEYMNRTGTDVATFQNQYNALGKTVEANSLRNNQAGVAEQELIATVENLRTAADEADFGELKIANVVKMWAGQEYNDDTVTKYQFHLQQLREEFAMYNMAIGGQIDSNGNIREINESDYRKAESIIADGISKGGLDGFENALLASMGKMETVLSDSIERQNKKVWELFGVEDQYIKSENDGDLKSKVVELGYDYDAMIADDMSDEEIKKELNIQ